MKKVFLLTPILFVLTTSIQAQHLGAYIDYMDQFYIFDKGKNTKIEDLKVQSFKVGGECVLYIDNAGHLKMYNNGEVSRLETGGTVEYFATDHLGAYKIFEKLRAIYHGEVYELSNRCTAYRVEDSLVVFYDKNKESLRVFYQGEIVDIESGMIGTPIKTFDSGDNIVAYVSERNKDFKVWYKGELTTVQKFVEGIRYKAGRNIVAYIDDVNQTFSVFYKGKIYELESFPPKSYKMGNDFVAYVDNMGTFKVFYDGEVEEIVSFPPDGYIAEDNVLAYIEDGYFKTFYKGEIYDVEGFVPKTYKVGWNTIAYLDNSDRIWIYREGEKKYFSNELVNTFDIHRDLIQMNVRVNRNIIYYMGKFYEGESFYK